MADPALAHLDAPADPRLQWDLPPFGEMDPVVDHDAIATRVLAPNPSPMTLDGTNTYVLGQPGTGEAVVLDPGPSDPAHRQRVDEVLARRDATCVLVLVTHHHIDHVEAAQGWADDFGCLVAAPTADVAGLGGQVVEDGDQLAVAGLTIRAVATPGHTADHTAYRLDHGPVLTGDHVLGRGTSVVAYPDGDLLAYFDSLRKVLDLGADALLPGHGPALTEDPTAVLEFYLDHRRFRERQILTLLEEGALHTTQLVRRIYDEVDQRLLPAAAASTRAALTKLQAEDRVVVDEGGTAELAT